MWTDDAPSLVAVLERRAAERPQARVYTWLRDGRDEAGHLTYGGLDARARRLASALQETVEPGERALLVYEAGLEYLVAFWGCLYAGVVAVPAYPPEPFRPDRGAARMRAVSADARPALVLTTRALARALEGPDAGFVDPAVPRLATDALADGPPAGGAGFRAAPGDLAFLQYTSGSTSDPRGVAVTHGNLVANERMIRDAFAHDARTVVASWLPLYHDMGLIGNALQPVFVGGQCVLMSPLAFLRHPVRWLEAVSRYGATTSGGPNFGYDLCARRVPDEAIAALDLTSWRVAYCGAEPVRAATLRSFAERFSRAGLRPEALYPCYGLAEATLLVTGGSPAAAPIVRWFDREALASRRVEARASGDGVALVGCGRPDRDAELAVVDPETRAPVDPGHAGEIWVRGPHVAAGYFGRPDETARAFEARIAPSGAGPFLRTGDLGFVHEGELFVADRLKDLVIVAGRNHYPHDLEQTVERCSPLVRPGGCAAFAVEVDGGEGLGLAVEVEPGPGGSGAMDGRELVGRIRRAIARDHRIAPSAIALVRRGALPRTSSGKIQRGATRRALAGGALEPVARWPEDGRPRPAWTPEPGAP